MKKSQLKKIIKGEITKTLNEGSLMEQGNWDYSLMDQIESDVEELNSVIGKYDRDIIQNMINKIISNLKKLSK
tara:strand:+ start:339 stop:557 length:219 start_codon:yes stop_codon:yes gene_type:complete